MGEVTTEEMVRMCAVQAVRIERLMAEKAQMSADLATARAAATTADAEVARLRAEKETGGNP